MLAPPELLAGLAAVTAAQWTHARSCLAPLQHHAAIPVRALAVYGLGQVALAQQQPAMALVQLQQAYALLPTPLIARQLAQALMLAEDWPNYWQQHEARLQAGPSLQNLLMGEISPNHLAPPPVPPLHGQWPRWQGQPLAAGQKLLVWLEQGIGEEIMFATMLPELAARVGDAALVIEAAPRLVPLFARACPQWHWVVRGEVAALARLPIVAQIAAGSLGLFFRQQTKDFPATAPQMIAPATALVAELHGRYRGLFPHHYVVALSWRSKPFLPAQVASDAASADPKSIPFALLVEQLPRTTTAGQPIIYLNAQYGDTSAEQAVAHAADFPLLTDPSIDPLQDLDRASAQLAAADAVLCVSNAAAHLAGAMRLPTHVLLPMGYGLVAHWHATRPTSLWYPTCQLLRQTRVGDWASALAQVKFW